MRMEQSFEVPVPVEQAWGVLLDVERIVPCMPGATLTSFDGTGFTGTVKVKFGPVSLAYKGSGRFTERDVEARRMAFVAQGQDSRGAGGASARVTAVLHAAAGGQATLVRVVADIDIAGRAAQFGRGLIADVSGKLIKQFADSLAETIAASAPVAPAPASAFAASAPAAAVDATPLPLPPPLTPVFVEPVPPPVAPAPVARPPVAPPAVAEPAADYTPPPTTNSAPPEYHPLALQEPPADAAAYAPPTSPTPAGPTEPVPVSKLESTYAYAPDPQPTPPAATPPAATPPATTPPATTPPAATPAAPTVQAVPAQPVAPTSVPAPAPREAEPIDLLAVSGAKGMLRRAAPVLIIVALAVIGVVVWLALG